MMELSEPSQFNEGVHKISKNIKNSSCNNTNYVNNADRKHGTGINVCNGTTNGYPQTEAFHFVRNPNIHRGNPDNLYHLALNTSHTDMTATFGDVKFVVLGGSSSRMEHFAKRVYSEIVAESQSNSLHIEDSSDNNNNSSIPIVNISKGTDRYVMYKAGPVLIASHGIGVNSFAVVMHEILKLLHYASVDDVTFFRVGTSGGLGVKPGTLIITEEALDGMFNAYQELIVLGKKVLRPAQLDQQLVKQLALLGSKIAEYDVITGKTICACDFYEGQGRLDGAFCDFTEADKKDYLITAYQKGVRNIEMESLGFAAMCHHAGVRGAVICVALLDRFQGDQLTADGSDLKVWYQRPCDLAIKYIKQHLSKKC